MTFQKPLRTLALVAIIALTACATAGKQFDRTHIRDIKTGVQDKEQIRVWFGEPGQMQQVTGSPAGCIERWIYSHAYSSYGGMKTKAASLVVDFDRNAKVCDHAYVEQ
jgi:hypothetical protein